MPEGDTIHTTARTLHRVLAGKRVATFDVPRLARAAKRPPAGTLIEGVEARGKHLLVHFAGGLALHTHLGMPGSWHVYRVGERWQRPAHQMRARIETDDGYVAVCFRAPTVEVVADAAGQRPPDRIAALGPDLCRADADLDEVLRRLRAVDSATAIADVLLDQRVMAGVGNVYKSEALFACGINPFTPVSELDDALCRGIVETAARQLRANIGGGRRSTQAGGGLAVYGRAGRPCRRCANPILTRRQGPYARSTYWCPRCQPAGCKA